jgi:hypothetical protein
MSLSHFLNLEQRREVLPIATEGKQYTEIHPYLECELSTRAFRKTAAYICITLPRCWEEDPEGAQDRANQTATPLAMASTVPSMMTHIYHATRWPIS